jgi:hypothetical protein
LTLTALRSRAIRKPKSRLAGRKARDFGVESESAAIRSRAGKELKDAFGGNLCNAFDHGPSGSIRVLHDDWWVHTNLADYWSDTLRDQTPSQRQILIALSALKGRRIYG